MTIQAWVDESGIDGRSRLLLMLALVGRAENWALFSDEWAACLQQAPAIRYFKMNEAARLKGEFQKFSERERDEKLIALARIINRYVQWTTWCSLDLDAHARSWAKRLRKPHNQPYFYPFQSIIMLVAFSLLEAGNRDRFEIFFDEQWKYGLKAKDWYPLIRHGVQFEQPSIYPMLPLEPIFRNDSEFMPLQAADMFVWNFRQQLEAPDKFEFNWLAREIRNVERSHVHYHIGEEQMRMIPDLDVALRAAHALRTHRGPFPKKRNRKHK